MTAPEWDDEDEVCECTRDPESGYINPCEACERAQENAVERVSGRAATYDGVWREQP